MLGIEDRQGIQFLKWMAETDGGMAALEVIDRICLRGEIAYQPGNPPGMTEFRCGCQQVGKCIHDLIDTPVDWEAVAPAEKELEQQRKEQEEYEL